MKEEKIKKIKSIIDFFTTPIDEAELIDGESKPDELYTLCDDPMQVPIKLIDEQLRFVDLATLQELFVENSGFLVVGAIGLQGSGKSSILNILANCLSDDCSIFDAPFSIQTVNNVITNSPCTGGINLYITQDRVILLDVQPLLSFALTNYHTHMATSAEMTSTSAGNHTGLSSPIGPGNWNLDVWAEMASMQIVAFLVNVCHVVLVVSDDLSTAPTQLHSFIDRAIGLKPTVFTPNAMPFHVLRSHHPSNIHKKPSCGVDNSADVRNLTAGVQCLNIAHVSDEANLPVSTEGSEGCYVEDDITSLCEQRKEQILGNYSASNHFLEQYFRSPEAESRDVSNAVNRLINLTDYSASLIHIYNQAPAAAFLDPIVCESLDRYKNKIIPLLYPEYRRLMSLVTVGPRILSTHLLSRNHDQSTTTCQNSVINDAPTKIDPDTTVVKLRNTSSSENRILPENSTVHDFSGFPDNSSRSGDDYQENSAIPMSSILSGHQDCLDPSSVLSDKGLSSSQKPFNNAKNISAEKLISTKIENESNIGVTLCIPSLSKSQEKLKCATTEKSNGINSLNNNSNNDCVKKFGPTESEIVSQCCSVLRTVEEELKCTLKGTALSCSASHTKENVEEKLSETILCDDQLFNQNLMHIPGINGEKLNASLVQMYHDIQTTRRNFFNVQKRLDQPRLFMIPEVNSKGQTPVGCPTYLTSARILQEAVFSTPRQHMMPNFTEKKWITYAHQMWDAVIHSPLLLDYHSVLMNQI